MKVRRSNTGLYTEVGVTVLVAAQLRPLSGRGCQARKSLIRTRTPYFLIGNH